MFCPDLISIKTLSTPWALTAEQHYTHSLHPPLEALVIHLVQPPLAAGRHPPLGCPPLLVPELPLGALVTEDLDLGVAAVIGRGAHISSGVLVGVNLDMQRQALHSFLCTAGGKIEMIYWQHLVTDRCWPEISGKTLYGKIHFGWWLQGVPVDGQGVVWELLYVAQQADAVLGVHINDSLLDLKNKRNVKRDFNVVRDSSNKIAKPLANMFWCKVFVSHLMVPGHLIWPCGARVANAQ